MRRKKGRGRLWIFFLVFCCSSNVLVRWFRHHSCASGVWHLFRAHRSKGSRNFLLSSHCPGKSLLSSLPRHVSEPTYFQTLTSTWCHRVDISVSGCSTPAHKIWDLWVFSNHFDYRRHSPETPWPTTSAWLTQVSWLPRRLCLLFLIIFFFWYVWGLTVCLSFSSN